MNSMHKKRVAVGMCLVMLAGTVFPYGAENSLAAKRKPSLSKKSVTVQKGKSVKVSLKNKAGAKKIKWSVKNKKVASIKKKKASVTIRGLKAGSTKVNCTFVYRGKKKKLTCKVKVIKAAAPVRTDHGMMPTQSPINEQPAVTDGPKTTTPAGSQVPATASPTAPAETDEPATPSPTAPAETPTGMPPETDEPATPTPTASQIPATPSPIEPSETPTGMPSKTNEVVTPLPASIVPATAWPTAAPETPSGMPSETNEPTPVVTSTPTPTATPEAAQQGVLMDSDYSNGSTGGFKGRGSAAVKVVTDPDIADIPVLSVTGRTSSWNGTEISLSDTVVPGNNYKVSTAVYQNAVSSTTIKLTLSYVDSGGNTQYTTVASETVAQNNWATLTADMNIPSDAKNIILYFEEDKTNDFYVAPVKLFDTESYDKMNIDDFDNESLTNYAGRSATISISSGGVIGKCLQVTGRTASWNGVSSKISIAPGASVYVSGYVRTEAEGCTFKVSAQGTDAQGADTYPQLYTTELTAGEWTRFSCVMTFEKEDYQSLNFVYFELEDTENAYPDFYLDNMSICVVNPPADPSDIQADSTYDITGSLLESFQEFFGNVGTCINYSQLNSDTTLAFAKSQYNSITPENETKPDSLMSSGTISVSDAEQITNASGESYYYIPDNYNESTCPKINYTYIDNYMKKAYENGLRIRFHVFVWHQQTPKWFFKENYDANGDWVSAEVMNARMELYIKSVIKYISMKEEELGYGDVVYCYDVVNEYFHNNNNTENGVPYKAYWDEVYYPDAEFDVNNPNSYKQTTTPVYVKSAFTYAREILDSYGKTDITLFYNDFNTYIGTTPDDIIAMMKYINSDKTLCDGIGMQSHLAVSYPSVSTYCSALEKFLKSDYIKEVQITELDVTAYEDQGQTLDEQMTYYYNLMKSVLNLQKTYPEKLTGLTFWGLFDSVSWRKEGKPLLFTSTSKAKGVYFKVLQAAEEAKESAAG